MANEASASDIDVTFTAGSITADESAAGAIGGWVPNQASASDIDVTFTADNITAGESVAGAVGGWLAQDGTLSEVETDFNAGNITAGESVGGMVGGWLAQTSTVRASDLTFSARTVEADASVGGLVGGWVANNASVHNTTLSADIEHARGGNAVSGIVGGDLSGNGENTRVRLANVTADFHATRATTEASDDAAVSGIAWEAFLTELDTVSVRMTVDETETVYATGGVGAAYSTKADRLDLQVDMAGTAEQAGGAIGVVESPEADIRRTSVSGSLVFPDTSSAGGFVGRVNADGAVIDRSRADVDVTGGDSVGGFVGNTTANGSFDNTAATGSVTGSGSVGGYAGALLDGVVRRSFATGAVDSGPSGSTGGVAGETADAAAVTETYWDTEATGVDESPVGSGLTTAEMTGPAARGNVSGFDFEFTWTVTSPTAYPRLRALDGRKQDGPANVTDWYDLDAVRENPDGEYVLTADLNRSTPGYGEVAGPNANSGQGFEPIGNATQPFTGTVDGDGHTIFGIRIDRPDQNQIGVFGQNTGTIRNVSLGDVEVLGATSTGALVGSNEGLVARASSAGSTATDDEANAVGGLVGQNRGTIEASRSSGTVTGARQVDSQDPFQGQYGQFWTGGLVGYNEGIVSNSTSSADVTGSIAVGGLVGQQEAGPGTPTIENSSAHGRVSAPGFTTGTGVGGLVGRTYGEVRDSFATGAVSGSGYFLQEVGGLAGSNTGTIRDSYWDRENSGRSDSAGGTPLTTAEMTGAAARENMSGFDFENTWVVPGTGEYPRIRALLVDDGETSATEITDWYELDAVRENRSRNYTLTNDLDETTAGYEEVAGPAANNGTGFEPIGNDSDPFTGTFDGAGHTISGLTIDRTGENTVGLFGASDGTVSNVTLSGASVTGGGPVGALVGENTGTVAGVSAQVEIDGSGRFAARIGGLVGENRGGVVADASARGTVTSDGGISGVGGLVGRNDDGAAIRNTTAGTVVTAPGLENVGGVAGANANGSTIRRSAALGSVTGGDEVGGVVGINSGAGSNSTVVDAYSTGHVDGDRSIGGLVGANRDGAVVRRTYSRGGVSGTEAVGGLVGENADSTVRRSYSVGAVTGDARTGGLVGLGAGGNVADSYWDVDASGRTDSAGGVGRTTAAMTGDAARENISTFDFRRGWIVLEDDTYPELRAFLPGEESAFRVTDVRTDRYLRDADGTAVTVEVTNLGDRPDTQDVTYRIPTEEAQRADRANQTLRVREAVTLEANESTTFEFRLPRIEVEPPSDVGFRVDAVSNGDGIRITNTGSDAIAATEVVVDGENVSGVDGPTPLADLAAVENDRTLDPGRSVTVPAANRNVTLRVLGTTRVTTTVTTFDGNRSVPVFLSPSTSRPVPTLTASYEQPIPIATDTRFEVGQSVMSYFTRGGSRAPGRTPTVTWDFGGLPDGDGVDTDGPVAEATFEEATAAPAAVSVEFAEPTTTFRMEPVEVGTPEEVPPVLERVVNSDGYYISDPNGELEPGGGTTLETEFRAQFLAPDQIDRVTFAPSWLEDGNVTVTDGRDGWTATFDVTSIPNTNERTGPDATLTVVAVDDQGRTVEEQDLYVTDPPRWTERIYRRGGTRLTADDGAVGEAVPIPKSGFDYTVDAPSGTPLVGGKEVGVSGSAQYGVETYQLEGFAGRYGDGTVEVGVPVGAVVDVNQTATIGAVAEYRLPQWRLNGKARFYVNARTLLTRPIPIRVPGSIPVAGGKGFNASGYAGPGYGIELRLSGVRGGSVTLDEALGYGNFAAGAEGGAGVAGQEAFARIDGRVEGNGEATIDNTPERFSAISLSDADLGGRIGGEVGARIRAPRIGGEYSESVTLVSVGSKNVERPGPPFASLSSAPVSPLSVPRATTSYGFGVSSPGDSSRIGYDPVDGELTDNSLNDTDPAIGGSQGSYTVAWSGDAPDRPQPERAEIYVRDYVNRTFGDRTRLTDDTAYNVDPTVARTPDGTTVVAWARIDNDRLRNISDANLTFQDVRNQSEVAYAVNDGTGWSETRVLTDDTRYQGAPVAAGFDDGFVIAYERDGDFDYTTLTDETVEYTRLSAAGDPVENGTLGRGLNPRAATGTDGTAVRVARERRTEDAPADVVVATVDDTGTTTTRTATVANLTTFDVASGAVAWANTTPAGESSVTVANDSAARTVPLGNGTTVRELRLATAGDRRLLQYQGTNPTVDTGFLPNPRTTYYQRFRNGSWSPARTVNQAVDTSRILYDHAVTSDTESFVSVAAGVDFGTPGAVDDLYYVDHEYRPDLTVSIPAEERESAAAAGIGETVEMNVTVANTGDTGTDRPVALATTNATGDTRSTVTLDPIAPGTERTASVTTTVTRTGKLRVVADRPDDVRELSETNNDAAVVVERPRLTVSDTEQTLVEDGLRINATVRNEGPTVATNATVRLVDNDETARTALTERLAPSETGEVSFTTALAGLNRSRPGSVRVRAVAPSEQQFEARAPLPLQRAGPTIAERSLRAFRAGNTTVVAVTIENDGLTGARRTLRISYGDDRRTRQVCVPPATQDRPTAYRRAIVATPGLSDGTTVTASLRAPGAANATRAIPATSGGTATRADVRPTTRITLPVVAGRVPADTDCDGAYEDFSRDGAVTIDDAAAFFDARNSGAVAAQRPRFDGNNDTRVNVHDVQTVLADSGAAAPSARNATRADTRQVRIQPTTTEVTVPANGTATLPVAVPNRSVGAFDVTARIRGAEATVAEVAATDSRLTEQFADRNGGAGVVAAGHATNETILDVVIVGSSPGDAELVIDTAGVSNGAGKLYETPDEVAVSVNVTDSSIDDGTGPGDPSGGDGSDAGTGSDGGSDPAVREPQVDITDLPDGVEATLRNVDDGDSVTVGPTTVSAGDLVVTQVTATFDDGSVAANRMRVDAEAQPPRDAPSADAPALLGYVTVEVNGSLDGDATEGSFTVTAENSTAITRPDAVQAYHYDEQSETWESVPTRYLGDDRFQVETDGFSTFAVGLRQPVQQLTGTRAGTAGEPTADTPATTAREPDADTEPTVTTPYREPVGFDPIELIGIVVVLLAVLVTVYAARRR